MFTQLKQTTLKKEVILEIDPITGAMSIFEDKECIATFELELMWDFILHNLLNVSKTKKMGLYRRTKEAKAVIQWRRDNA